MAKGVKKNKAKKIVIKPKKKLKIKELRAKAKDPTILEKLIEESNKPKERHFRYGAETAKFCVYMMEKYGDDYQAMARDARNYYQESAGQIRKKIKKFKSIPENFNWYVKAQEMIENETMMETTSDPCTSQS